MSGGRSTERWIHIDIREVEADGEVEAFLDREWEAYHRDQGHDLSVDWSPRPLLLTARDDTGRLVGVAQGRISAGIGHLSELIVAAPARGQGIGGRLLEAFEARCLSTGCHKLTIHTDYDGPAHHFYRQRGWLDEAVFHRDRGGRDFVRLYKFTDE